MPRPETWCGGGGRVGEVGDDINTKLRLPRNGSPCEAGQSDTSLIFHRNSSFYWLQHRTDQLGLPASRSPYAGQTPCAAVVVLLIGRRGAERAVDVDFMSMCAARHRLEAEIGRAHV